jgi:hypothetical protein
MRRMVTPAGRRMVADGCKPVNARLKVPGLRRVSVLESVVAISQGAVCNSGFSVRWRS